MTYSEVGVVTVNYNAGKYIYDCIESLQAQGLTNIICVDNGSSDGSPEEIEKRFPDVKLIRLPNPGFGAANNAGAALLQTEYVFLLNPDTVLHEGAIDSMIATMQSDHGIAIAGPKVLNVDGTTYASARRFPVLSNAVGHAFLATVWPSNPWTVKYRNKKEYETATSPQETDWVSGSAMFTRREAFESVNGFDKAYFMYMEDVDLCWRLRENGWKIVYDPNASITHVGGVSTGKKPYRMLKAHHVSAFRYNYRTAQGTQRLLLPVIGAGLFGRLGAAWLKITVQKAQKTFKEPKQPAAQKERAKASN